MKIRVGLVTAYCAVSVLSLVGALYGCGGSNKDVTPPVDGVAKVINASGGAIELNGVASAVFPSNSFSGSQLVSLRKADLVSSSESFDDSILINGIISQSTYEVILNVGNKLPLTDAFELALKVPEDFLNSTSSSESIRAFAHVTQENDIETLDSYETIPASYDPETKTLKVQFNRLWLTNQHNGKGEFEAIVTIATIPGPSVASAVGRDPVGVCGGKALQSPLPGMPQISGDPPRGFNPNPSTNPATGAKSGHWGSDLVAAQGTPVFAAETGVIERVKFPGASENWPIYPAGGRGGQYIVVRHSDGSKTMYMHLSGVSVAIGDKVTAGQQIGNSGGTKGTPGAGGSTGPHLHFEYSPNGQIYDNDTSAKTNPIYCFTEADATGTVVVSDNGPANDDVFEVRIDGILLGATPKGGSDTFGLSNLRPGTKTLAITCIDDGDSGANYGTLGVALNDGVTFVGGGVTASAEISLGETVTYEIVVPASSSVNRTAKRVDPPKNPRPSRGD